MRLADDVSALQHQAMGGASGRCTLVDHGNLAEKNLEVFGSILHFYEVKVAKNMSR